MRIAQLANFWTPTSGGLRVSMEHLAAGYATRGHRVLQIVPGARDHQHPTAWGRRTSVAAPRLPGTDYRLILRGRHVERLLDAFAPDVVEVADRTTLARTVARWAPPEVRIVLVAHERVDAILDAGSYGAALDERFVRPLSDRWNPRLGCRFDRVVVPSRYGAEEWQRVGIAPAVIPWGVDTGLFHPDAAAATGARGSRPGDPDADPDTGGDPLARARVRLVWVGRLSAEKRPDLAVETLAVLERLGVPAHLTVIGDGPMRQPLESMAASLPVTFTGHLSDPHAVAGIVADATASLSTSGIETSHASRTSSTADPASPSVIERQPTSSRHC